MGQKGKPARKVAEYEPGMDKVLKIYGNYKEVAEKYGLKGTTMLMRIKQGTVTDGKVHRYISPEEEKKFRRQQNVIVIPNTAGRAEREALEHFRRKPYS